MLYGVLVKMVGSSKVNVSKAVLSCMFLDGVLCSYRKDGDDFRVMERCFKCSYYKKFLRLMEEEEDEFWVFESEVRKYGWDEATRREELRKKKGESGS